MMMRYLGFEAVGSVKKIDVSDERVLFQAMNGQKSVVSLEHLFCPFNGGCNS